MLVYDYLDHIARIRGLSTEAKQKRLSELADMCGLREIMHKTIETLSKGLKQRVGLAHAMMSDPEILVLDEPTSGLDPNQIAEIREIIRRIGEEKTVILSTHILSEAEATCDRIVIIHNGRIIADGTTGDLQSSVGHSAPVRISLRQADPQSVRETLQAVDGVNAVNPIDGEDPSVLHVTVTSRKSEDLRPALYAAIKATDWVLLELQRETKTLESIFRELTREN
jgi:ABC-2 type transport system ATP-binding protein